MRPARRLQGATHKHPVPIQGDGPLWILKAHERLLRPIGPCQPFDGKTAYWIARRA
jgi:hypothetical protein